MDRHTATNSFELGKHVLESQPFSRLVGARLLAFGGLTAVLEIDIEDRHRQQHGLVHGGLISYLADNVLTFAAGLALGPDIVTSGISLQYLAPAREGVLRATGTVTHNDKRYAFCTAVLEAVTASGAPTLCAVGSGTATVRRVPTPTSAS